MCWNQTSPFSLHYRDRWNQGVCTRNRGLNDDWNREEEEEALNPPGTGVCMDAQAFIVSAFLSFLIAAAPPIKVPF